MTQVIANNTNNTVKVYSVGLQGAPGATGPSGSLQSSNSGSFSITGSLTISGSNAFTSIGPSTFSGSVISTGGFTGSLSGSSSNAISSSYALTASYALETLNIFPYFGTAQITGSIEVLATSSTPLTSTSDFGIKVVRYSSAFGFPGSTWGGYLYPLSATTLYDKSGNIFGSTKNPLSLQPFNSSQDIALKTVNHGANILISASNEIYLGFGSNTPSKTFIRDTVIISGSLTVSGSEVLTLVPVNPLPTGVATGSFAVSGSTPPRPYFFDGTSWIALI